MSFLDPFLEKMKLNDEDEEYMFDEADEDEDDEEEEEDVAPVRDKRSFASKKRRSTVREALEDDDEEEVQERPVRPVRSPRNNIVAMRTSSKAGMEVCMIKPTSVDDGVEICDTLRSGRTVVINLEGIPTDVAQRIIDFASGACYAMNGNMQPISNFIVLATPKHVELTGDFNDVVSGNGINVTSRNN